MNVKDNEGHSVPIEPGSLNDKLDAEYPIIYADQLSQLVVGPFVSRFTVSVEDHGQQLRVPVASVVMPTNMMYAMAHQILASLSNPAAREKIKQMLDEFGNEISPE